MFRNPFTSIRKSSVICSFLVAFLTNSIVFATPVSQAFYNFSKNSDFKNIGTSSVTATIKDNFTFDKSIYRIEEEGNMVVSNYFAIYSAQEQFGEIGVKSPIDADYIHDNYFRFTIPDLDAYRDSHAVLSYAIYGVDAKGATKSINNSAAYGGQEYQEDASWKQVKEYVPLALLQSGENEVFFNRYTKETYAYQIKDVQLYFQETLDASLEASIESFESTWQAMHSLELSTSLSGSNSFSEFSIISKEDDYIGWVFGLDFKDIKPLPRELHNLTQGAYLGYRWKGDNSDAHIEMRYDKSAIPAGYSFKDVKIYYFDAATRHWSPLPEIDHDYSTGSITASMIVNDSGETDYISGVITQPEHPEVAAFTPIQISDIEYANPSSGVISIAPPTANSRGVASTSFPLKLPAGRNGMQPQLSIDYNSEAGNGWLGKGWDLSFSSISVDTKWGVPEYHSTKETEVYTLDGQELVLKNGSEYTNAHREENISRATNRTFYLRKEGAYLEITRHGSTPSNYWWSVTDTEGYTRYYGGVNALNRNSALSQSLNSGAIAQWALVRTEDPYGNSIDYTYTKNNVQLNQGVIAQEFYLSQVTYTRHSNTTNYYEVNFIRDARTAPQVQTYPLREDITTNARFGFLTVNQSLLREIQVSYMASSTRNSIRYYTLDYTVDSYGQNLLEEISEFDSDKKLFYSNTLEYYNDIGGGATIEGVSEVWDIKEKALKTPLHSLANPTLRGMMSEGSSLGVSSSSSFSSGFRTGVGFGFDIFGVGLTGGPSFNFSINNQESLIDFIDINGDGLPDKVIKTSSGVYYRPNLGNGFGNLHPIMGISRLSQTKSISTDEGFDLFFGASVGGGASQTSSSTDNYFTDFNGDGLPDLVANNLVHFNSTQVQSDYSMREFVTNNSSRTQNPIASGKVSQAILEDIDFETLEELRSIFPQYDHVKMWTAPYTGTVSVSSIAKLLEKHTCSYSNDFRLSLEKYLPTSINAHATQLQTLFLTFEGQQLNFNRNSIPIQKGEVLFFRVHNQNYGCGGEVEWNPKITYTTITNIPNSVDENGMHLRQYDAQQEFIYNNGGSWVPHEEATSVTIDFGLEAGRFNATLITDDIYFKMEKIRVNNNTGDSQVVQSFTRIYHHKTKAFSGATNVFTNAINTTTTYSYSYHFSAESHSNIAWHKLNWRPTMTSMGRADTAPVSYSNFEKPLFQAKHWISASDLPAVTNIPPGQEHTDYIGVEHNLIDMPTSLNVLAMNYQLVQLQEKGALPLPVHWVVKAEMEGEMQVLYNRTLYLMSKPGGGFGFSKNPNIWLDPTAVDKLFFLSRTQIQKLQQSGSAIYAGFYSFADELVLFDQAEIMFSHVHAIIPPPPPALAQITTPIFVPEYTFSGVTYRGWREFLYNGSLKLKKVDGEVELDTNGVPIILENYGNSPILAEELFSSFDIDYALSLEAMDIEDIEASNFGAPLKVDYIQHNSKHFENKTVENARYGPTGSVGFPVTITIGRAGVLDISEYYFDPNDIVNTVNIHVGLRAYSKSKGSSVKAGAIVVSTTNSNAESYTKNQYLDLNGDGYPDIITKSSIQYTNASGALQENNVQSNNFYQKSLEHDISGGVALAGMYPSSDNPTNGLHKTLKTMTNIASGITPGTGHSNNMRQWLDVNGDGLPDQVHFVYDDDHDHKLLVRLNTGYSFLAEEQWQIPVSLKELSSRVNVSVGVSPPLTSSYALGLGASASTAKTKIHLVDVNGDGLPDLVYKSGSSYYYYPNLGVGFHTSSLLLYNGDISESKSLSGNVFGSGTFGVAIPLLFVVLKFTTTVNVSTSASFNEATIAFQDIDGDGLPDVLSQIGDGTSIRVRRNQTGKTGLLKTVHTPLGGHWTIDYTREGNTYEMASSKWVLAEVKTHDGFIGDNNWDDAKSASLTTFTYENGKYDRRNRSFYGFEKVVTEVRNPQTQAKLRYSVQEYLNEDFYTQGALIEQRSYDANDQLLAVQSNFYNLVKPDLAHTANFNTGSNHLYQASGLGEMDRTRASLLLVKTATTEYESSQSRNLVQHFKSFDTFGNILTYENIGSSVSDSYLASITYKSDAVYKRLPITIEIRSKSSNELLKKRTAQYNSKGSLTQSVVYLETNKTNRVEYAYDAFGNRTSINKLDVLSGSGTGNYSLVIGYDTTLHTYPVSVSDSYNESSSMVYDYLFGIPVEVTDRAGSRLRTRIDNRGRAIEITGPKEFPNGWTIRMEYQGEDAVATQVQSNHARNTNYRFHTAKGSFEAVAPGTTPPTNKQHYAVTRHNVAQAYQNELLTISIVDGFGSPIQVKKTHLSGTTRKWQVSGKEHTDVFGRNIKSYQLTTQTYPSNIHQLGSSDLSYSTAVSSLPPLETQYDTKDRPLQIRQPGESSVTTIQYALQQNTFIERIVNELGQTQETHTDLRGRQIKSIQNDEITTKFYYNIVGDLLRVRNHAGFDTEYTYNMGGLRTREVHPDRGVTSFTYDNAGRMTKKKTSNLEAGQSIDYTYHYDRLTKIKYPQNPLQDVEYTYSLGRISEQRDAVGIQRFRYGNQGELVEQMSAMAVAGKTSYWFKTQWNYDSWGRVRSITYPDDEQVSYSYDQAGQLKSVSSFIPGVSAHAVVSDIRYNDYGEREQITYGNGTQTSYTYDTRRRLSNLSFNFTGFQQTKRYGYDSLSNILDIQSATSTSPSTGVLGGPVNHSYTYDNYNRLIHAKGDYVGPNDRMPEMLRQEYSLEMLYDESHSILTKSQNHRIGAVTNLTTPLTNSASYAPTAYHLEYEDYNRGQFSTEDGYNYTQPHAPRAITQYPIDSPDNPNDPRIEKQLLDYDARGNLTHIEREVNNPDMPMDTSRESVQKLVWDEEDRLLGVDLRPESSRGQPHIAAYTYDASGERSIRYVPRQQEGISSGATSGYAQDMDIMLYPNALVTVRPQELTDEFNFRELRPEYTFTTYTKHYYIGSERISSKLGTRKDLGILCEEMGGNDLIDEMNTRAMDAGERLEDLHTDLDKDLRLNSPYPYSPEHQFVCGFKSHNPELYDAYWYHPDHLGSSSFITNTTGEISQHMEYLPFGETFVEEHLNSYNSPFKFNGKEYDAETGNYYYGARYMNPKWSMWLGVDPLAELYYSISPYAYVANNPISNIDPDGRQIVGVTKKDAQTFKADVHRVLADEKFAGVRALIDLKGSTFKSIDAKALGTALDGVTLSADERAYVDMVTNTINSKDIHKIEYLGGDFTSSEGATAFKDHMNKAQAGVGDMMLTPEGKLSAGIIDNYGGGLNVPTKKGSHSFIGSGVTGDDRAVTSGHELFGHGIPSAKNLAPKANNANAIRTDNLIRRLLGMPERDGSDHGGFKEGHITEPKKLPITQ